jgi:hypothetical protein
MRDSKYLKATGLLLVLATTASACGTSTEGGTRQDETATAQSALWSYEVVDGGVAVVYHNDTEDLDTNMVVAILKQGSNDVACTGALMTPTKVLTTAYCARTLCQMKPRVAVGAVKSAWKVYNSVVDDGVQLPTGALATSDLAMITLAEPVVERARADRARLTLEEPVPTSQYAPDPADPNVQAFVLTEAGMAGWSPLSRPGSADPIYQQNRQLKWRDDEHDGGWLAYRRTAGGPTKPGYWHLLAYGANATPDAGLRDGDWGAPLFAKDLNGSVRRLIGIASEIATSQSGSPKSSWTFPSCMTSDWSTGVKKDFWACDSYIDLTQPAVRNWVRGALSGMPTDPAWLASHPRINADGYEWWVGELDYIGSWDKAKDADGEAKDADGDHWYDRNSDKSPRDNCPGVINYDQKDTDNDGLGDVCDDDPNTARVQPTTKLEVNPDESLVTARQVDVGDGKMQPVKANYKLRTRGVQTGRGGGVLQGNTRAMACECPGAVDSCMRQDIKTCEFSKATPVGAWKGMSVVSSKFGAGVKQADEKKTVIVRGEFHDTSNGGDGFEDDWTWEYWNELDLEPLTAESEEVTKPAFDGLVWSWVKNFGETRPEASAVTEPAWAEARSQFLEVQVHEVVPPKTARAEIPVLPSRRWIPWGFPPDSCPMCGKDSLLHFDLVSNPVPMSIVGRTSVRGAPEASIASPSFAARSTGMSVRSLSAMAAPLPLAAPVDQIGLTPAIRAALESGVPSSLVSATDSGKKAAGVPVLAVLDPETHAVVEAYAYSRGAVYSATVGRVLAPPYAVGTRLTAALSAERGELAFVGENLPGENHVPLVRSVNLRTGEVAEELVQGLDRSVQVLAAAYSEADNAYYVLDIGVEETGARVARLAAIDANTKQARVVGTWAQTGAYASYHLTIGTGNTVAITAQGESGHAIVLTTLGSRGNKVEVVAVLFGTDPLAMPALVTDRGLSLIYTSGSEAYPTLTRLRFARDLEGSRIAREIAGSKSQVKEVF